VGKIREMTRACKKEEKVHREGTELFLLKDAALNASYFVVMVHPTSIAAFLTVSSAALDHHHTEMHSCVF
jgi:hypothetical protein